MLIEQHQQPCLFDGSAEHELKVAGAAVLGAGPLELFFAVLAAEVGGQVQEKGIPQPLLFGLLLQAFEQFLTGLLQSALFRWLQLETGEEHVQIQGW